MNRVTHADLQRLADDINAATDSPMQSYVDGKGQIGNFYVFCTSDGACLHRIVNEYGGITTPLRSRYRSKRELYNAMQAFLYGLTFTDW